jgi:hypothetical protein
LFEIFEWQQAWHALRCMRCRWLEHQEEQQLVVERTHHTHPHEQKVDSSIVHHQKKSCDFNRQLQARQNIHGYGDIMNRRHYHYQNQPLLTLTARRR